MKTHILVQLPTCPEYWGSIATPADVDRILDRIESMIRSEFEKKFDLEFERTQTQTPRGSGVHSENEESAQEVWEWISDNWTAAL